MSVFGADCGLQKWSHFADIVCTFLGRIPDAILFIFKRNWFLGCDDELSGQPGDFKNIRICLKFGTRNVTIVPFE